MTNNLPRIIALLGSGEYLPVMNEIDRSLLTSISHNGTRPRVVCIPAASGPEGESSWGRWNRMGVEHFQSLGADVTGLPIIDRESANNPQNASVIENADIIYFSGGNPHYLYETMSGSRAWDAAQRAWERGAIYAGCSAGAMILGENLPEFRSLSLRKRQAFSWLPNSTIIPHFDQMLRWRGLGVPLIQQMLGADEYALGIDEDTAILGHPQGDWTVWGQKTVSIIARHKVWRYNPGETFNLNLLMPKENA